LEKQCCEQFDDYRCHAEYYLEAQPAKHKNEIGKEAEQTSRNGDAVSGSDSAKNDKEKTDHQNGGKYVE